VRNLRMRDTNVSSSGKNYQDSLALPRRRIMAGHYHDKSYWSDPQQNLNPKLRPCHDGLLTFCRRFFASPLVYQS
jgi:hypothetical protein